MTLNIERWHQNRPNTGHSTFTLKPLKWLALDSNTTRWDRATKAARDSPRPRPLLAPRRPSWSKSSASAVCELERRSRLKPEKWWCVQSTENSRWPGMAKHSCPMFFTEIWKHSLQTWCVHNSSGLCPKLNIKIHTGFLSIFLYFPICSRIPRCFRDPSCIWVDAPPVVADLQGTSHCSSLLQLHLSTHPCIFSYNIYYVKTTTELGTVYWNRFL